MKSKSVLIKRDIDSLGPMILCLKKNTKLKREPCIFLRITTKNHDIASVVSLVVQVGKTENEESSHHSKRGSIIGESTRYKSIIFIVSKGPHGNLFGE